MTEERSKRRELLPFIFVVKCFKKPFLTINKEIKIETYK